MNFALISKIAAALLGVGLIATTVVAIVPAPDGSQSIWIDQPVANSTIGSGATVIAAHASWGEKVTSFRFVIRKGGTTVKVLNDTTLTVENKDRSGGYGRLVSGAVEWDAAPGDYTIEPRYIASGEWIKGPKASVTVLETPPPDAETPTAQPESPGDQPVAVPTEEPSSAPTAAPTQAPTTPTVPDAPPQLPTGTIQRFTTDSGGYKSTFSVQNVTPEFVDVDVQVRTKGEFNSQWDPWISLGCSDLTKEIWSTPEKSYFGCEVKDYSMVFSSQERQAQVRVVITNYDDESLVFTANGPTWTIIRSIG